MSATSARTGSMLGASYRLERELGVGGMATVYVAEDLRHHRKVAVKVLHPELAAAIGADRFLKEIELTASLQHPHILPLFDSGNADGLLFYVMPFVDGETLRRRLQREGQLPVDDAVRIAVDVAAALDYAHRRGVVHRDIKPENILLHDGRPLVADFGIALALQQAGGNRLTQTGLSLGTPQYMAPEQAAAEKSIDHRADVYALGSVTYEMLAGEPPFTGPTVQAVIAKVITDRPHPLTRRRHAVPPHVEGAVNRALEKLPADRFQSAGEFARAITTPAAGERTLGSPARSWLRPALAVAAAAALFALGWALGRTDSQPSSTVSSGPPMAFSVPADVADNVIGRVLAAAPDGGSFVYAERSRSGQRSRLMLRRLDEESAVPLQGTDNATNPVFSPNGEWIAYEQQGKLRKLNLRSGVVATLADVRTGFILQSSWSVGDEILLTTGGRAFRVSANGGALRRVPLPSGWAYAGAIWLPGGEQAIFTRSRAIIGSLDREMVVYSLATGRELANLGQGASVEYLPSGHLAYTNPEGQLLLASAFDPVELRMIGQPAVLASGVAYLGRSRAVSVALNGTVMYAPGHATNRELVLVDPANQSAQPIPVGGHAFRGPRFSPDGRRIAVGVENQGDLLGDIHVFDRESGTFTQLTRNGTSIFPEWSRDGSTIFYSALHQPGGRAIYRVPIDRRAAPTVAIADDEAIHEVAFAPRGDTVLIRVNADSTGRDILLRVGGKETPFLAGPLNERSATISPDGRLVLYVSDESGRDEVYVRPLATVGSVPVSVAGGSEPRWGPGGREAYYWAGDTLFAVPVSVGSAPKVGVRRVVHVGEYFRETFHSNYDVAPDGRGFVFVRRASQHRSAVTVLVNWLPKATAASAGRAPR